MSTATYVLVLRSKGRSVRIPKRISAAFHLCGGKAFVNISAAWSSVWMYSMRAVSSLKISARQDKLTLCVLVIWRSLGLYPFFTTKIVAWLSSYILSVMERASNSSHNCNAGRPSWYREWAKLTTSLSVVDREVDVWRLLTHARGKWEFGPESTRNPPEVERAFACHRRSRRQHTNGALDPLAYLEGYQQVYNGL